MNTPSTDVPTCRLACGNVALTPPWQGIANKLTALFEGDNEITVTPDFRDPENRVIRICVNNAGKCNALIKLLPEEYTLGDVKVALDVVPGNKPESPAALARMAFAGNPNFEGVTEVSPCTDGAPVTFAEFAPDVAQFWNDDLSNPHGVSSALYADLASELFRPDCGLVFTTALKN